MKRKQLNLPEFAPWYHGSLETCLRYPKDLLMLKLEVGSECNACCSHCPSSCRERPIDARHDFVAIDRLMRDMSFRHKRLQDQSYAPYTQGFICGVGEPTTADNREILDALLKLAEKYNFNLMIRTNLINWDKKLSQALGRHSLSVLANLACLNHKRLRQLMRIDSAKASLILSHFKELVALTQDNIDEFYTSGFAVQLVASLNTLYYMREVIERSLQLNIPLAMQESYMTREVDDFYCRVGSAELNECLNWLIDEHAFDYRPPICPAIFSAIAIDAEDYIVVDRETGLSCTQCFLEEREIYRICKVSELPYKKIVQQILEYRLERLPVVREMVKSYQNHSVLGGCGGRLEEILKLYLQIYESIAL